MIKSISIIIPCYNEEKTIEKVLNNILNLNLQEISKEIIIIDDGSTDTTPSILNKFKEYENIIILNHKKNFGKRKSFKNRNIRSFQ